MIPTMVWPSKQACSWQHTTWVSCKFTRHMPNRTPQTKGITSSNVIIIAQSKSCAGATAIASRMIPWQKLHSHAYTRATVCSFVSFTHYLIYLRRQIAKKIRVWCCLLHRSFPSHSW
jgi:hypothetical protein